ARLSRYLEGLYFVTLDGQATSDQGKKFTIHDREYFPQMRLGAVVVTRIPSSRDTAREIELIIVPIYDAQQKQIAALGGAVRIDALLKQIDDIMPPDKGFAALIDGDGHVFTPGRAGTKERREDFLKWIAQAHDGNEEATLGGVDYLLNTRLVPQSKWRFVLAKPSSLATEKAVRVRYMNLLVSSLALVVAFVIALVSTKLLLSPLGKLLDACRRFGDGDWKARATNLPNDELGELGTEFNRTADRLEERYIAQLDAEQIARASEARFRLLLDHIGEAIFLHDMHGRFIDVNAAACSSLGYTREELLQLCLTDIVPDLTEERVQEVWQGLRSGIPGFQRETRHRHRNGGEFPVEVSVVPLQTPDGMQVLASVRDISERKRAEDKMAKFFRLSDDMMCIADTQGIFRQLSPAFEQVLGWAREELLGQAYIDFVHPDDREMTIAQGGRVVRGEEAVNFENRYRCRDGSYRWLQWRPFREVDEGMIYAIARDVTESYRLMRLMEETSAAAHIGGWEIDFIKNELYWTDETYRLHDLSPRTFSPKMDNALEFYAPASRPLITAAVEHARIDGQPWDLELELITAQGRHIWAHALGRVDVENGVTVRAYGSFQDITERKQAEEERRLLDNQLREMQRMESIGVLAGGIAHDFNNLLTGILGFTRLALSEPGTSDTLQSHLQQIETCSMRAADLCKQLLAYAGKGKFVIETISLSDLVRDTAQLIETIFGSPAKLELDLAAGLPRVEGDATQLRQVVMNLTTNAYDALEENSGKVRVRTGLCEIDERWLQAATVRGEMQPGPAVIVEVTDTGCGMDAETLAHIFDPFFTTKFAGRGLGLAAVLGIVRSHHGALRVATTQGAGSTFTVALPVAEDCEEMPASSRLPTDSSLPSAGEEVGTVLVIDDEASVRSLAATALERGGFRVLPAESGQAGLELYRAHRETIVAVLVDMTMPGINGLEVVRAIREQDARLPLLLMSGYTDVNLDTKGGQQHHSGFVQKPFRLNDLNDAIRRAIQQAAPPPAPSA
ncbi:MAG TPA: PAS domain S-box protein, partial [Pirellulaceae bacterium]|nr:PAS domain S-box protein [Pirellulaceae bacterium]